MDLKKFTALFKAPVFPEDPERTRQAQALNALLINMFGATLLLGTFGILFAFQEKLITGLLFLAGFIVIMVSMGLNRRGQSRAAAVLILTFLWTLTVFILFISGGMRSLDMIFFLSGTVIAGITLGAEAALAYAGLSLLAGLGFAIAGTWGVEFPTLFSFPPFSAWVILFLNLVFVLVPLHVSIKSLAESAAISRANAERYRLIATIMSDYVFFLQYGPDGRITDQWVGGAFEFITGYTSEEYFSNGGWSSIVHPDDRGQDALDLAELRANRKVDTEIRILRKDGEVRWVRSYAIPVWDGNLSRPMAIYGAVQDITDRKKTSQSLQQRADEVSLLYRLNMALTRGENLYQALRDFVRELKLVMVVDAFHIGLYDAETDIFSYSLFLNLDQDILPPPRKLSEKPGLTWEVISNKKTLYIKDVTDPEIQKKYTIVVVVEAPIRTYIGIPLLLQDRVIGIMSVQSLQPGAYTPDQVRLLETLAAQVAITIEKLRLFDQLKQELEERKIADAELQQREAILQMVADAANTFLNVTDWSVKSWRQEVDKLLEQLGTTIRASHAYMFENHPFEDGSIRMSMRYEWTAPGFESDLQNPRYKDMILGEDYIESWNSKILRGQPFIGDAGHLASEDMDELRRRGLQALLDVPIFVDGQWWGIIGFDDMARPHSWSTAEVDALVVAANLLGAAIKRRQMDTILQDELHQRKLLIDELENKNVELERFNYTVSHDLKSPLVTIKGFLGYLEDDATKGNLDRLKKDIARISSAVDKMNTLLADLLDLSRIGRTTDSFEDIPFEDIVHEALELTHGRLTERNITVQTQPGLPIVHGNRRRLIEVVQNLLDNAAKYMGPQPAPRIVIGFNGGDASDRSVFFVRDNGIGIAPEYHDRIFRLFDKLDSASEGTAIGLALVKRIVEFHGGRIWVESEPGKGSVFYFTLKKQQELT